MSDANFNFNHNSSDKDAGSSFVIGLNDNELGNIRQPSAPPAPLPEEKTLDELKQEQEDILDDMKKNNILNPNGCLSAQINAIDTSVNNTNSVISINNKLDGQTTFTHGVFSSEEILQGHQGDSKTFLEALNKEKTKWRAIKVASKALESDNNFSGTHESAKNQKDFLLITLKNPDYPMDFSLAWMVSSLSRPWTSIKFFFRAFMFKFVNVNAQKITNHLKNNQFSTNDSPSSHGGSQQDMGQFKLESNHTQNQNNVVWRQGEDDDYCPVLLNNQDAANESQGLQQATSSYRDGRHDGYSNISPNKAIWGQSSQNSDCLDVPAQNHYSSGNGFESGADYLPGYSSA